MAKSKVLVFAPARKFQSELALQHESDDVGLWAALPIGASVIYGDEASRYMGPALTVRGEAERRRAVVREKFVDIIDGKETLTVELAVVVREEEKYAGCCEYLFGNGSRCCGFSGHLGGHICCVSCRACDAICVDRTERKATLG